MYETNTENKSTLLTYTYEKYGGSSPYKGSQSWSVPYRSGSVYSWRGPKPKRDEFGWRKPNDFSVDRFEATYTPQILDFGYDSNSRYKEMGPMLARFWPLTVGSVSSLNQDNKVLDQAIRDAYASLNDPLLPGLTWLAEGKETLQWLAELFQMFSETTVKFIAARDAVEGAVLRAVDKVKKLSQLWLTYRYAIMPVVLQIEDAMKFMAERHAEIKPYTGYVSVQLDKSVRTYDVYHLNIIVQIEREVETTVKAGCKLYPSMRQDNNPYGFGLYDALLSGWELLTLSFVVDWFIGIGPWLASLRPVDSVVRYQSNTKVVERKETLRLLGAKYAPWYTGRKGPIGATSAADTVGINYNCVRGTVVHKPVLPMLNVKTLSWMRQLDATALFLGLCIQRMARAMPKRPLKDVTKFDVPWS